MNIRQQQISISGLSVAVVRKDIKNVHLSVHPPQGRITISAPQRMSIDTIRVFTISKLSWIKKQQAKMRAQKREAPREYVNRESHYYFGKRYLLKVVNRESMQRVILKHNTIELYAHASASIAQKEALLNAWYRQQLKKIVPKYIAKWEKKMKVKIREIGIKKMKTRWGTCNAKVGRIWLNLELAKKPLECVEYVIVHELVHLLERKHSERFVAYMDKFMPIWRGHKEELNRTMLSHEEWSY